MAEQKVSPIDPSSLSWRDKLRNLATTRYGYTGKQLAEAILGESEEEKYMNYLEKIEAGLLPPPKNFTGNRPVSDMFGGEGISDIGLLDATLAGISGMGIPKLSTAAALTESGVLGADAVGEYRKGNTVGAAIMGTLAGVPPLLRYANPVKNTSSKEVAEEVQPDLQRRKVVQGLGIGALATPFMGDPLVMATRSMTKTPVIKGLAKLTSPIPKLIGSPFLDINSKIIDNVVDKIGKDLKIDDLSEVGIKYDINNIMHTLEDAEYAKLSLPEIKKLVNDEALRLTKDDKDMYKILSSDAFIKHTINGLEKAKQIVRDDPDLLRMIKEAADAEQAVMDLPGGFSGNVVGTRVYDDYKTAKFQLEKYVYEELPEYGSLPTEYIEGF